MKLTTIMRTTSVAAILAMAASAMAQDFPPYPEQAPISPERQGIIAEGKENAPDGGRPEINTVEEMLEMSGYTAPGAIKYAALAANAADGQWGAANYYHCKNTPGGTALNAPYPVPLEVFDGVYSIGDDANNIWAIEIIVISHGHGDHTGGLAYMKELTGARIAMSKADWDLSLANGDVPEMADGDFFIEDGMTISLGDRSMNALLTPGHAPGTVSLMIPVT